MVVVVFYDWPFPNMCTLQRMQPISLLILGSVFSDYVVFYGDIDNCDILSRCPYWREHTHTHQFNGPLSGTTWVSRYQKGTINLDFTEARDSGWQWHQVGDMQVCTSLQTDNHASTPPLSFLQAEKNPSKYDSHFFNLLKQNIYTNTDLHA